MILEVSYFESLYISLIAFISYIQSVNQFRGSGKDLNFNVAIPMKLAFSKLMAWVNITSFLPKVSGIQSTPVWLFELRILFCVAFVNFDISS